MVRFAGPARPLYGSDLYARATHPTAVSRVTVHGGTAIGPIESVHAVEARRRQARRRESLPRPQPPHRTWASVWQLSTVLIRAQIGPHCCVYDIQRIQVSPHAVSPRRRYLRAGDEEIP
jgi:hypothetical protein